VIAATHQHLEQRVRDGAFREDLYHRLNVIRLRIPPLRERREDVPLLARNFLLDSSKELGMEPKRLSDAALARLAAFDFPGNVRQLQNLCHWLTVMAPSLIVEPKDLPPEVLDAPAPAALPGADADAAPPPSAAIAPAEASPVSPADDWTRHAAVEATADFARGDAGVWDRYTQRFEAALIRAALAHTRGKRIEAARLLGIGRNTITRKIQELGIDAED
jgi:two-component system, NtrC family, nitrogen regulation response regulator GlnG